MLYVRHLLPAPNPQVKAMIDKVIAKAKQVESVGRLSHDPKTCQVYGCFMCKMAKGEK